jgi:hypothetical protein
MDKTKYRILAHDSKKLYNVNRGLRNGLFYLVEEDSEKYRMSPINDQGFSFTVSRDRVKILEYRKVIQHGEPEKTVKKLLGTIYA